VTDVAVRRKVLISKYYGQKLGLLKNRRLIESPVSEWRSEVRLAPISPHKVLICSEK
jgi:hypothetical protein